jgi:hypothetical protein
MKGSTFLWILGGVTALITIICALCAGDPDYDVRDDWGDK